MATGIMILPSFNDWLHSVLTKDDTNWDTNCSTKFHRVQGMLDFHSREHIRWILLSLPIRFSQATMRGIGIFFSTRRLTMGSISVCVC